MTLVEIFIKNKRVQKTLSTRPGEEGFSLIELVVVIAVLAILSAVAIPSFTNVQANARASAVQNGLVNGLKECFVLQAENSRTQFGDTATFSSINAFRGFTLQQKTGANGGNTCFAATAAAADNNQDSNFTIFINDAGIAVKECTHGERAGCTPNTGNAGAGTW